MKHTIEIGPDGCLRLGLPSGRTLDLTDNVESLRILRRILYDAEAGTRDEPGYIAQYPTQHIINSWAKRQAQVLREAKEAEAKRKAEAKEERAKLLAKQERRALEKRFGFKIDDLKISL